MVCRRRKWRVKRDDFTLARQRVGVGVFDAILLRPLDRREEIERQHAHSEPAQILRGFGMRVLAFDLFPSVEWAQQYGVEYTDAHTLASQCEVISLHTPLTPATYHIIRRETLELMKPGAILLNVSRGALIDTK